MSDMLRKICLLSCLFGPVTTLIPEKGTRQITEILCTCILIICILEPFTGFAWEAFSFSLADYYENEKSLTEKADSTEDILKREVIERESASYILEKAESLGVRLSEVRVSVRRTGDGIWTPWETYIAYKDNGANINAVSEAIETELGVPKERQHWTH